MGGRMHTSASKPGCLWSMSWLLPKIVDALPYKLRDNRRYFGPSDTEAVISNNMPFQKQSFVVGINTGTPPPPPPPAMSAPFTIFFAATALFLIVHASAASSEGKISNDPIQFSYVGATGPAYWGSLSPAFSACSKGKSQSPIDIATEDVILDKNLKPLTRQYISINATLVNNGFNIGIRCGQNSGFLVSDGKVYKFKQMHWHSPSEHKINGNRYAAELHLVHIAGDGSIAVLGILYHLGHADPLIAKIESKLYQLAKERFGVANEGPQIALGEFNMHQLKRNTHKYYRYTGSLTTPPCNETVAWYILGKVRSMSREQLEALRAPLSWGFKNNARPTQALNGRAVELYEEVIH